MRKKLITIVGARPQFVKAATLTRALKGNEQIEEKIIHTGQHYDDSMSEIFFRELQITPPFQNLHTGSGGHGETTGKMLAGIEKILIESRPDAVLVYGDTNSTLAGALAASKLHIPIVHVEAGLRSFNRKMPEEINRVLTDHLSSLLFASTDTAVKNLQNEGISAGVKAIGDVSYDATLFAIEQAKTHSNILKGMGLEGTDFAVLTLHRAENTDDKERFAKIWEYVLSHAQKMKIVFPVHPRTRKLIDESKKSDNIIVIDPVGYFDMHALLAGSKLVLTDSGGLQKEAYFHQIPCITIRDETEWVETIEAGWNMLWTVDSFKTPRKEIKEYGDGDAAGKIVKSLEEFLK